MTTIYLVRHAQAEGNVGRRCHGIYDSRLTMQAMDQLPYVADRFENPENAEAETIAAALESENGESIDLSVEEEVLTETNAVEAEGEGSEE